MDRPSNTASPVNELDDFLQTMPDSDPNAQRAADAGETAAEPAATTPTQASTGAAQDAAGAEAVAAEASSPEMSEEEKVFDAIQGLDEAGLRKFMDAEGASLKPASQVIVVERLLEQERTRLSADLESAKQEAALSPLGNEAQVQDLQNRLAKNSEALELVRSGSLPSLAKGESPAEEEMRHLEDYTVRVQELTPEQQAAFKASPQGQTMAAEGAKIAADFTQRLEEEQRDQANKEAFDAMTPDDMMGASSPEERAEHYAEELQGEAERSEFTPTPDPEESSATLIPPEASATAQPALAAEAGISPTLAPPAMPQTARPDPATGPKGIASAGDGSREAREKRMQEALAATMTQTKPGQQQRIAGGGGGGNNVIGGAIDSVAGIATAPIGFIGHHLKNGYAAWSKGRYESETQALQANIDSFKGNVDKFNKATNPAEAAAASTAIRADLVNLRSSMGSAAEHARHMKPEERAGALTELNRDLKEVEEVAGQLAPGSGLSQAMVDQMKEMAEAIHSIFERLGRFISRRLDALSNSLSFNSAPAGPAAPATPPAAPPAPRSAGPSPGFAGGPAMGMN